MKNKETVIYKIINLKNDKCYIGSAVDFRTRKTRHLSQLKCGTHHSIHLQRAYEKYGKESFEFIILENVNDITKLIEREQFWLDKLVPEYNITLTAGLNCHIGIKRSSATKKKISESLTGIVRSQETKDKISKSKLGVSIDSTNMNKDKIGKPLSKQHKDKIAKGNKNKIVSKETRNLISETLKKQKLISAVSISVKKYSLDGELLNEYTSIKKAETDNGYKRDVLRYHLVYKNKTEHDGFRWVITKTKFYK